VERTQIFDLMGELKLYGIKAAFDEIMATAIKRQHEPQRIVGDLLTAEISEKQARKYQLTIAKLPLAKDIDDFQFDGTPINQTLVLKVAVPLTLATEPMRMIDPPSFIRGKAFCTVNSVPLTLRSKSLSKRSSVRVANGANSPMPALATRTSIVPFAFTAS
jgi:IstB-like ATP binding protein